MICINYDKRLLWQIDYMTNVFDHSNDIDYFQLRESVVDIDFIQ